MNKIKIITVGRKSSKEINILVNNYEKRLKPFADIEWTFIEPQLGKMSISEQKTKETEKIFSKLQDSTTILLDEKGKELKNKELVVQYQNWKNINKDIIFVIGGAYGVSDNLISSVDFVWSLSKLVFPHELMRLILLEQLYRTESIINNLPYHHE